MAAELRWILAALSAVLLAGIWFWGVRRSRQAPGNAQLRESTSSAGTNPLRAAAPADTPAAGNRDHHDSLTRDRSVSPFEPLNIRTADFEAVPLHELSMTAHAEPFDVSFDLGIAERELAVDPVAAAPLTEADGAPGAVIGPGGAWETELAQPASWEPEPAQPASWQPEPASRQPDRFAPTRVEAGPPESVPSDTAAPAQASPGGETQRIVTVRVCSVGATRWPGTDLIGAFHAHGLAYGRYQVFHRNHGDGRTLFCAASLVEPGTFDIDAMPQEQFRGLTLFAVLPGPANPVQTWDALIETAAALAATLRGSVQDSAGMPMSPQRAAALREDVARFAASW